MTKEEALKLALEALDSKYIVGCGEWRGQQLKAITAIKEALAQPAQEPLFLLHTGDIDSNGEQGDWESEADSGVRVDEFCAQHPNKTFGLYTTPPQRPWVGLMRGVRVEGDTVIISVKGGNDAARELCGSLIKEMEA